MTKQEIWEFGDKHWCITNKEVLARMSDKRYHYFSCSETCYLMGEAIGQAMLEMVK